MEGLGRRAQQAWDLLGEDKGVRDTVLLPAGDELPLTNGLGY